MLGNNIARLSPPAGAPVVALPLPLALKGSPGREAGPVGVTISAVPGWGGQRRRAGEHTHTALTFQNFRTHVLKFFWELCRGK